MYDPSTDRSRGVGSEAGSLQQQSSMMKNASDPSLRSTSSSFADLAETAAFTRHAGQFQRHEEQDIFSAVGGMELGVDADLDSLGADIASTSGHEPHPEPSRTLFVRHINPAASDEDLLTMFKVFGDVRHMYTVSKHRGFIMVTYFDLRAAARAQAALHGALITSLPLDVHFCAPKGDPTVSQGTVSLFNLDPDTSNDHLVWLFSKFGDVKDIRESPDRRSHKFITFYDTRQALAALRAMNKAEHLGKLPSNITPQLAASLSQMTMHDTSGVEAAQLAAGKGHPSRTSSQPGTTSPSPLPGTSPAGPAFMSAQGQLGPQVSPAVAAGLRSGMHVSDSASSMSGSVGAGQLLATAAAAASGRSPLGMAGPHGLHGPHGHVPHVPHGAHGHMHKAMPSLATLSEAQALDDPTAGLYAAAAAAAAAGSMGSMLAGSGAGSGVGLDQSSGGSSAADVNATASMLMGLQLSAAAAAGQVAASQEQQLWALQQMAAGGGAGQGQGPMWGAGGALYNQQAAQGAAAAAAAAANLQALRNLQELQARQQQQQQQMAMAANLATLQGQAMSAAELNAAAAHLLNIAGLGQALGPAAGTGATFGAAGGLAALGALGGLGAGGAGGLGAGGLGANAAAAQQLLQQAMGNMNALSALGNMQAAALAAGVGGGRLGGSFGALAGLAAVHGQSGGPGAAGRDAAGSSRGGGRLSRRTTDPAAEMERKMQQEKLYALDAVKIRSGEDRRTTLMIKNIPNKYTQKMLLATIDEQFRGTYDFFYLPIDFKNKCNVGYAFINMINPFDIIALVERFNNRRWERFNSEKVCSISYARIQGRAALVAHFQNSSLMHEDKRCRPILFTANGTETTDPEAFQNDPSLQPPHGGPGAGASSSASLQPQHAGLGGPGGPGGMASSSLSGAGGSSASLGSVHSAAAAAASSPPTGGAGTSLGGGISAASAAAAMAGPARIRAAAAAVAAASASGGMLVAMGGGSQGQLGLDIGQLPGMGQPGVHHGGGGSAGS
ncbi:hypothetical protein HYH02_012076 [Chlamydomonas schloesseri]|uniref:RRM domain-containing protein n=1 Tax=Chlamydomonas schloesseri TaxID=2026947 RepID=A0A835W3T6_9CHLO|nr:hypothetical protein HYH02_012076 [Chlamydomonas schloesseri]|eukprot:KAG2434876.1 hypothetical protein HYH02_012076 [Chlamydomonas schloesseri]